jgi:hypothetical protein
MKRNIFILGIMLFFQLVATAQNRKPSAPQEISFGIKGGINLAGMSFTAPRLSELPQSMALKPVGGVFVDLPLLNWLAIVPELMYVEWGMATHYTHYSGGEVDYTIHSRYVDFRLPVLIGLNITSWFQPYLVAGGDVGYLLGGSIHLEQQGMPNPDLTTVLGKANMFPLYFGTLGGLGLRFFKPVNGHRAQLRMEATYNQAFVDTFSKMEHNDTATPLNVNAYNITGKRFPRGVEIIIGLVIPLIPDKDACYSFSKNKYK